MTAKERAKFNKLLEQITSETKVKAIEVCEEISLPLEIEALGKMVETLQAAIEAKKYMLDKIKEKKEV